MVSALRELRRRINSSEIFEEGITEDHQRSVLASTNVLDVLVYTGGGGTDISWIFQGIRHISGIKEWGAAPQGNLINRLKRDGKSFTEIGQQFGMSAVRVGRLYRGFRGLEQMKRDEDYGAKMKPEYFSLFDEAHKNTKVRDWLGWVEIDGAYSNSENLKRFYSFITPDNDNENKRRIHDPKHVALLATLLEKGRDDLLGEIERHETSIELAAGRTAGASTPKDPIEAIRDAKQLLTKLSATDIAARSDEVQAGLSELSSIIETLRRLIQH